jgi:hypothetical protein
MHETVTTITDKVMRMIRPMLCVAVCSSFPGGATAGDIAAFLGRSAPAEASRFHQGLVERALRELLEEGKVVRPAAHWYPATA